MPKCMTFVDETIDQKDTCTGIATKDVVDFILEEVLHSALIVLDKDCNQIGDFNVNEDFCQQFDQKLPSYFKDLEKNSIGFKPSSTNPEPNLRLGENTDRSLGLLTAKENLDLIIDAFTKGEEKVKNDCKIISEEVLADNELQIQNGQIRLEAIKSNKVNKTFTDEDRQDYFKKEDVIKDEKIEIEYFNDGKLNKIYVPLCSSPVKGIGEIPLVPKTKTSEENLNLTGTNNVLGTEKIPLDGELDCKQILQNSLTTFINEEMSQAFPDATADPNRPRACAFAEEDVQKMTKEIEEISFNQTVINLDGCETAYHSDGQGDADLESKSFTIKDSEKICTILKKSEGSSEHLVADSKSFIVDKTKNKLETTLEHEKKEDESPFSVKAETITSETENKNSLTPNKEQDSIIPEQSINAKIQSDISSENQTNHRTHFLNSLCLKGEALVEENVLNLEKYNSYILREPEFTLAEKESSEKPTEPRTNISTSSFVIPKDSKDNKTNKQKHISDNLCARPLSDSSATQDGRQSISPVSKCKHEVTSPKNLSSSSGTTPINDQIKNNDVKGFQNELIHKHFKTGVDGFNEHNFREGQKKFLKNTHSPESNAFNISQNQEKHIITRGAGADAIEPQQKETDIIKNNNSEMKGKNGELYSPHNTQSSKQTLNEKEKNPREKNEADSSSAAQNFRLRSHKMFIMGVNYDPTNQETRDLILTNLEDEFIDSTENVIQIINPQENSLTEISDKITFSLFNEINKQPTSVEKICVTAPDSQLSLISNDGNLAGESEDVLKKKIYSGMTTIGPVKNFEYDPKDLTAPDIDFGKMTRITSSRQLAKDIFGTELRTVTSAGIIQENGFDEGSTLLIEGDRLELSSLVNRDIASLTKVQKVREVMSYYPKAEEDFEDEDTLTRSRLDLKDVESMTDERYKVPEVSIPLLSFEINDDNLEDDKEMIEKMHLVLSGNCFDNSKYCDTANEENTIEINDKSSCITKSQKSMNSKPSFSYALKESTKTEDADVKIGNDESQGELWTETEKIYDLESNTKDKIGSFHSIAESVQQKYKTLGSALKKASNRFVHKDSDLCLRNSKSLPRDTTKLTASGSIKSILDDCHSSASNVLKKSRSLLKNTQSILKTLSQSRFSTHDSAHNLSKQKTSPSDSDICNVERKLSSLLRKEDFARAKNLIKAKMEKTFKNVENTGSPRSQCKISHKNEDVRTAETDEDKHQAEKTENCRKSLPKSPLVYKSQFVKNQVTVRHNDDFQHMKNSCPLDESNRQQKKNKLSETQFCDKAAIEDSGLQLKAPDPGTEELPKTNLSKVKLTHFKKEGYSHKTKKAVKCEEIQPAYIVMETVQGLPMLDPDGPEGLDGPDSLGSSDGPDSAGSPSPPKTQTPHDNSHIEKLSNERYWESNAEEKISQPRELLETTTSTDFADETSLRWSECEDKDSARSLKKCRAKNKKFGAKLRSFWFSAFGKIKTQPKNVEPS